MEVLCGAQGRRYLYRTLLNSVFSFFFAFKLFYMLEHLQQWSNTLNLDAKLKKKSSSSGAIMGAKRLLMNSDQLFLLKFGCKLFISKKIGKTSSTLII